MATDTTKITGAADELSAGLAKGGTAAKTLGAEIANVIKSLDDRVSAIEAGGSTQPPITPPPNNTYGLIENFNPANGARYKIDGLVVANDSCAKPWSLTKLDNYTLRVEVREGDVWAAAGGSYTDSGCNRCELSFADQYNEGSMMNWEATVTVLPGPKNTGSWCGLVQSHATTNVNPTYCPFAIQMEQNTDRLQIILQEPNNGWNRVYLAPNAVVRGQPMRLRSKVKMAPTGGGSVAVWLDDAQIVNFAGKVGATNSKYYWKCGIYRGTAPEVAQVEFKNIHITTG